VALSQHSSIPGLSEQPTGAGESIGHDHNRVVGVVAALAITAAVAAALEIASQTQFGEQLLHAIQ
jgi:hypothetical protein